MQAERKWYLLSSLFLLLITSGQCTDSKEVKQKERQSLLDHILQVIGDSQRGDKPTVSSRYNSGLVPAAQDMKFSSGGKPRLDNSRPIDNVPRDINLKDKFIKHFTGPVKFSSECRTHFHRLYHNTRDCSRPAWTDYIRQLQKMCQIANTASNESTLLTIVDIACSKY